MDRGLNLDLAEILSTNIVLISIVACRAAARRQLDRQNADSKGIQCKNGSVLGTNVTIFGSRVRDREDFEELHFWRLTH